MVYECDGTFAPQYRKQKEMRKNPFYGNISINDPRLNTKDEFIETMTYREIDPICIGCKSSRCRRRN